MTQTITATYEDGVLKPTQPVNLPDQALVRITIEPVGSASEKTEKLATLQALWQISKGHSKHLTRDELHERR